MTIRRRLGLSFLIILLLFASNLVIYFWGNQRRNNSVQELRQAISRQIHMSSIKQNFNDIRQQVALLSQVLVEAASSGAGEEEIAQFQGQLEAIRADIEQARVLSDSDAFDNLTTFGDIFQELSQSWMVFYENFGVDQTTAIVELAIRADPLSQQVMVQLNQLQVDEQERVELASTNFYEVTELTDRITIGIFLVSILVAVAVAYLVSRYLTTRLGKLKLGAALIGSGELDHRIAMSARDELGDLAETFNQMSDHLLSARTQLMESNQELEDRNREIEKQRKVSESLLLNILPTEVAQELEEKGKVDPKYFEDVTILFADFVSFTLSTEKLAAEDLVHELHDYFTAFDEIVERYGIEKLKTIGDSYMCVGGLPVRTPSHPVDAILAAFEIVDEVVKRDTPGALARWSVRIGVHTGPVIAGVVGIKKFAFDIWGESVNFSSRMEASGAPNRINLSERTFTRVKDFFECEHRGKVITKEKKEFDMYFANGILETLIDDDHNETPPPAFLRRYRIYFQKDPPSFPVSVLNRALS